MAKKTIARAHLVQGKRWYLDITLQDEQGDIQRIRREYDLNTIENETIRLQVAQILLKYLVDFLPASIAQEKQQGGMSTAEGLQMALDIKLGATRPNTHKGFRSITGKFLLWAKSREYDAMPISQFSRRQAHEFWDSLCSRRQYRGNTLNTLLTHLKSLWQELVDREHCAVNPWRGIKPARREDKLRRPFTPDEKRIVATAAAERDYWLFRAILLQYYGFIRPVELTRLKFRNFDFSQGTVTVESSAAKSWKKRVVTLPASILPYFIDGTFDRFSASYFVFGFEMTPGTRPCNVNRLYKRHLRLLTALKKEGSLQNTDGLTWYSWKDTGITQHAHHTTPLATRDQAGHSDMKFTLMYYHADPVNAQYRDLPEDLLPDSGAKK